MGDDTLALLKNSKPRKKINKKNTWKVIEK